MWWLNMQLSRSLWLSFSKSPMSLSPRVTHVFLKVLHWTLLCSTLFPLNVKNENLSKRLKWLTCKDTHSSCCCTFAQLLLSRDRFSCKRNEKVRQLSEVQAMTPRLFSWQSFCRNKTLWMKLQKLKVMLHYLFLKHFQQIPLSHLGCTFSHEWKAPGRRPQMKTLGNL